MSPSIEAKYLGDTPIATCHWQALANILDARGVDRADQVLCPTWGFGWRGDQILFGGLRWPGLVGALYGAEIRLLNWPAMDECRRDELALSGAGHAFVAEVDAYYLANSPYQGQSHVVHTIAVSERTETAVSMIDLTNDPRPVVISAAEYERMRMAPCLGRDSSLLIYAPVAVRPRLPTPAEVAKVLHDDLSRHVEQDRRCFSSFLDWCADSGRTPEVPRVAAERRQAGQYFRMLGDLGLPRARVFENELTQLSERWYVIHMLSVHEGGSRRRENARRMTRLMQAAYLQETELTDRVIDWLEGSGGDAE